MQFKTYARQNVDLIQHCIEQRTKYPDAQIHIGTDSISTNGDTVYFTVIAFRFGRNGVHFIFSKEKIPNHKGDTKSKVFQKLYHETELTLTVAESLVERGVFERDDIVVEFDYNNAFQTLSNGISHASAGEAVGRGYQVMLKFSEDLKFKISGEVVSEDQIAVKAANHLCQGLKS